jgi:hypothetical protein
LTEENKTSGEHDEVERGFCCVVPGGPTMKGQTLSPHFFSRDAEKKTIKQYVHDPIK